MKKYVLGPILIADDDPEDRMLMEEAFEEGKVESELAFVSDGEELMDYLTTQLKEEKPLPSLILLDLNMPRKDGREALKEMKEHPVLRRIPVVVLTTSKAEEDVIRTYDLGVSSFITKPVTFTDLVEVAKVLDTYWFRTVQLP